MRILLLESHHGVAAEADGLLRRAGHEVVRCEDPEHGSPCVGLHDPAACPLGEPVDVAVVANEAGWTDVEHGALCAVRERVPVVDLTPADTMSPYGAVARRAGGDLVAECERAASDGTAHAAFVGRELLGLGLVSRSELDPFDGVVRFEVVRSPGRLVLTITFRDVEPAREQAIVRAAASAIRRYDHSPSKIDVSVRRLPR